MNAHDTPPPDSDLALRVTKLEDRFDRMLEEARSFQQEMRVFQCETRDFQREMREYQTGMRFEMRDMRGKIEADFRILFGAIIASDVALAGLIAHVARWV